MVRLPIGTSDFAQLRHDGYHFVDKSGFIIEIIRSPARVVSLPRPRRFGKTLNLSMLRYWLDREADAGLFDGLEVISAGEDVAAHHRRHPVIFLTFKDLKHRRWEDCREHVSLVLSTEVERLRPTWSRAPLDAAARATLESIAAKTASNADISDALRLLTRALQLATGEQAVLLIDEYDTPIHAGWSGGYFDSAVELFRNLLSGGLKDNPHLYRGVLTGILRVAKESIFSGLNNVSVYTLLSRPFSRWFGFTGDEVVGLCTLCGASDVDGMRRWYNGYQIGEHTVYNPWSLLNYLSAADDGLQPYWVNTASNDILRDLLIRRGLPVEEDLQALLRGERLTKVVSEEVQLRELQQSSSAVWNFLLFSGYLKAEDVHHDEGRTVATLSIPNIEVGTAYREIFTRWLDRGLGGTREVQALGDSLLSGDEPGFRGRLQRLVIDSLSYFDTGGRRPEAVYQAFLVGLLVQLGGTHVVDSNRESGFGRYDVSVRPRTAGAAGAVLELKAIDTDGGETAETALDAAMAQVKGRDYASALRQAGAAPVWLWAAVFDGKRIWARVERG